MATITTPPAFPLRVLYGFQPRAIGHQASRHQMCQQRESWMDIHSLESDPFILVNFAPLSSGYRLKKTASTFSLQLAYEVLDVRVLGANFGIFAEQTVRCADAPIEFGITSRHRFPFKLLYCKAGQLATNLILLPDNVSS